MIFFFLNICLKICICIIFISDVVYVYRNICDIFTLKITYSFFIRFHNNLFLKQFAYLRCIIQFELYSYMKIKTLLFYFILLISFYL